jgi:heterogeneous nuclear rnp K-like protein
MSNQVSASLTQAESLSRKRSRSSEEVDDKQALQPAKRQNTGITSSGSVGAFDVAMSEAQDIKPTPSNPQPPVSNASSVDIEKPKDLPAKPENSATSTDDGQKSASASNSTAPAVSTIHMRCLIVTQDASIIIGKGGAHVNEIREKSGAKVMVSESIPGNPERILNVSGALDAVSKVSHYLCSS